MLKTSRSHPKTSISVANGPFAGRELGDSAVSIYYCRARYYNIEYRR